MINQEIHTTTIKEKCDNQKNYCMIGNISSEVTNSVSIVTLGDNNSSEIMNIVPVVISDSSNVSENSVNVFDEERKDHNEINAKNIDHLNITIDNKTEKPYKPEYVQFHREDESTRITNSLSEDLRF